MTNKEIATSFLKTVVQRKIKEAYELYIDSKFIHHNQYFKGDRQSLLEAMEEAHASNPNTKLEIKYVYEDGNTVVTHSHVKHSPDQPGVAVVHIFRIEDKKVVELWDLGQMIDKNSPNKNGMF